MIPNVQTAWETFVMTKCSEVRQASFRLYKETMTAELSGKLPCDNDVIRQKHEMALQKGLALLDEETFGIAATTTEKYLKEMVVRKKIVFQEKKIATLISRNMIRTALITRCLMNVKRKKPWSLYWKLSFLVKILDATRNCSGLHFYTARQRVSGILFHAN